MLHILLQGGILETVEQVLHLGKAARQEPEASQTGRPLISSTKGATGHLLGAAGTPSVLCVTLCREGRHSAVEFFWQMPWVGTRPLAGPEDAMVGSLQAGSGHALMFYDMQNDAGAVEAVFAVMSLVDSTAPPNVNLEHPEPGPWEDSLIGQHAQKLPGQPKQVMTNSFGFGGVNASLVFASPPIVLDAVVDGTP